MIRLLRDSDVLAAAANNSASALLDKSSNCRNNYHMPRRRENSPTDSATSALRRAIAESGLSFSELERRTGLKRQSMMRFARGEQSLRLDLADRLLECLGLAVVKRKAK